MKKILLFVPLIWLTSCNAPEKPRVTFINKDSVEKINEARNLKNAPEREDLLKQIGALEKELYASETLNEEKAKKIVSLYETYYQNYHKYPETPDFLFKAGEITENINQPYRSINFYTHCYEEYPAFKYSAECLFRMANLYDYKLSNYIKAKALYEEVKTQFPKSPLAKDADAAIKLMSKSDQDMIREFEKKNGVKK
jgi:tetratricopeptide (TPR) repeat protein